MGRVCGAWVMPRSTEGWVGVCSSTLGGNGMGQGPVLPRDEGTAPSCCRRAVVPQGPCSLSVASGEGQLILEGGTGWQDGLVAARLAVECSGST